MAGAETTKKAPRATGSDVDAASVPPVKPQQKKQQPAPLPAAGAAGRAADGSAVVQSCGAEDDQDDEQVERFYALLDNIRALRGLYSAGDGGGTGLASGGGRKRAREAEAPWTAAFRLEDFAEEVNQGTANADARCAVMNQGSSGGVATRRPAPAMARAAVAAADDGHEEDKVARGGNKLGRRVASRG